MMLILFIPFLVVLSVHSDVFPKHELGEQTMKLNMTHKEAEDHCELFPSGRLPGDNVSSTSLIAMMGQKKVSSVWMAIRKVNLLKWTWTDGEQDTTLAPDQGTLGRVCAGVSTVSQNIQPKSCNYGSNLEGVVCQHTGAIKQCPKNVQNWHCFKVGSVVFSFKCGVYNWYDARFQCLMMNASIAKLNSTEKIEEFVKTKNKVLRLSLCNFFWVGLRKEEWMVKHRTKEPRELETVRWLPQEPLYGSDCVVFKIQSTSAGWKTTPCSYKHAVVCMTQEQERTSTAAANATSKTEGTAPIDSTSKGLGLYIGVGTTVSIAILFITVCSVWCFCRRRHAKLTNKLEDGKKVNIDSDEENEFLHTQGPGQYLPPDPNTHDHGNDSILNVHFEGTGQSEKSVEESKRGQEGLKEDRDDEQGDMHNFSREYMKSALQDAKPGEDGLKWEGNAEQRNIHKEKHLDEAGQPDQSAEQETEPGQKGFLREQGNLNGNTRQDIYEDAHMVKINKLIKEAYQSEKHAGIWRMMHTDDWNKMVELLQSLDVCLMRLAVISNNSYSVDMKEYLTKRRSPSLIESLLQVENGDHVWKYFDLLKVHYVSVEKTGTITLDHIEKHPVIIVTTAVIPSRCMYSQSESQDFMSSATGATGDAFGADSFGFLSLLNQLQHTNILLAGEEIPKLTDDLVIIRPAPVTYHNGYKDADFFVPVPHHKDVRVMFKSAAYYTSLVIMMVIRLARGNNSYPTLHKELRNTRRMKQVLLNMCAPTVGPDEPKVLDPWRYLTSWNRFKAVTVNKLLQEQKTDKSSELVYSPKETGQI